MVGNSFFFMHKDRPLTVIEFTDKGDIINYSKKYKNAEFLPLQSRLNEDWLYGFWKERAIPITRNNLNQLLKAKNVSVPEEFLLKNLALSLTDCYWIRPIDSNLKWSDINLFNNRFKDNTLIWESSGDLSYSPNSSLNGNVEKTWSINRDRRFMIKGNKYKTSSQSINEVIASEIHKRQGYDNYTVYKLTRVKGKPYDYGCACELFTNENTELVTAMDMIYSEPKKTDFYDHLVFVGKKNGLDEEKLIYDLDYMILTDYVMCQTDRHFNNIGFLRDSESLRFIRTAPIYDSGEAFFANTTAPINETELKNIFTKGFSNSAEQTLKFVKDVSVIDLTKLPPVSYLQKMYHKDSKESETHINGICFAYEKRIEQLRKMQLGKSIY